MTLCNEADVKLSDRVVNGDHMVDVGGAKMTLNELMDKHKAVCDELEGMKKANAEKEATENAEDKDEDDDKKENEDDVENAEDKDDVENAEDDEKAKITEDKEKEVKAEKAKNGDKKAGKKTNAPTADELETRRKAKEKADRLRNADKRQAEAVATVETGEDKVARGKSRYGSN